MQIRLLIAAFVLSAAPGISMAMCSDQHDQVTMSCPEGQSFDIATRTCTSPTG